MLAAVRPANIIATHPIVLAKTSNKATAKLIRLLGQAIPTHSPQERRPFVSSLSRRKSVACPRPRVGLESAAIQVRYLDKSYMAGYILAAVVRGFFLLALLSLHRPFSPPPPPPSLLPPDKQREVRDGRRRRFLDSRRRRATSARARGDETDLAVLAVRVWRMRTYMET